MSKQAITVLGAGSWGTALAISLSRFGRDVYLFEYIPSTAEAMQQARENKKFLPDVSFPDSLHVSSDWAWVMQDNRPVVIAFPCHVVLDYLPRIAKAEPLLLIAACKGLHPETLQRVDQWLATSFDIERVALLSGPSFAAEVAQGQPTATTMAAHGMSTALAAAELFDDTNFRLYLSDDMIGVSLGGALKNVYAIAAGIASGMGLGHNSVSALITRGVYEMNGMIQACGGRSETVYGLSGMGDMVLTCTGGLSRNRRFGFALAEGLTIDAAKKQVGQVVEGVRTVQAAYQLARQHELETPMIDAVYQIINHGMTPQLALEQLLSRPVRQEH
ncbi:MAG: NAD(P)H-dependent glycerol-3-phosphate dehydrogenase [Mariprofundaceae bacterium]|nr:NAD(P)H-dependent glycerol-3-phosphate dehydrogenase [Mariprofundaceae bacterium]